MTDLSFSTLIGANFGAAILTGANLSLSNLSCSVFRNADLTAADLSGSNLKNVELINANFTASDLTDADLRGAKLAGSNFTRAKIDGIVLDEDIKLSILKIIISFNQAYRREGFLRKASSRLLSLP